MSVMLPFEENNKRKYCCFVCGMTYSGEDAFAKYKNHILDKHEEGRDFICCAFEYCKAPVRDLVAHCKARHPNQPIPKIKGQSTATVWRDFSAKKDKTPRVKKPKFRQGWFDSQKNQKRFNYRSGYESTVYSLLESDNDVLAYDVEPFEIPYIFKGKEHKYIPDIIVHFLDGHTEICEIKPSNQTALEKNKCKWYAAGILCESRGWKFTVLTEVGIDRLRIKIKNQTIPSPKVQFVDTNEIEPLAKPEDDQLLIDL
jgi:hypothetical protein